MSSFLVSVAETARSPICTMNSEVVLGVEPPLLACRCIVKRIGVDGSDPTSDASDGTGEAISSPTSPLTLSSFEVGLLPEPLGAMRRAILTTSSPLQ